MTNDPWWTTICGSCGLSLLHELGEGSRSAKLSARLKCSESGSKKLGAHPRMLTVLYLTRAFFWDQEMSLQPWIELTCLYSEYSGQGWKAAVGYRRTCSPKITPLLPPCSLVLASAERSLNSDPKDPSSLRHRCCFCRPLCPCVEGNSSLALVFCPVRSNSLVALRSTNCRDCAAAYVASL